MDLYEFLTSLIYIENSRYPGLLSTMRTSVKQSRNKKQQKQNQDHQLGKLFTTKLTTKNEICATM